MKSPGGFEWELPEAILIASLPMQFQINTVNDKTTSTGLGLSGFDYLPGWGIGAEARQELLLLQRCQGWLWVPVTVCQGKPGTRPGLW